MTQEEQEKLGIDVETYIRWGKEAAERGDRQRAYRYFSQVLKVRPDDEEAWLWKGAMSDDPEESLACMRKVLALNPKSRRAWQGFEWAAARLARARGEEVELPSGPAPEPEPLQPEVPSAPEESMEVEAEPKADLAMESAGQLSYWLSRLSPHWVPLVGLGAVVIISIIFFFILKALGG